MQHSELTHRIIGAAMKVHRTLGNGFQEVVYQRALAIEFEEVGIGYEREKEMEILYLQRPVGVRRVDFFVEETVMVELKAIVELEKIHLAQAINYLEAYGVEDGLLINFGAPSLQFKRLHRRRAMPIV